MTPLRMALALGASLALAAPTAVSGSAAAETDISHLTAFGSGRLVKNLQMGVGKSVIVDLPEDASEIYVGDPRIANAIVRSARRIYVSAIANGQTTIFALGRDGQKIAVIQVSVGRDVGELSNLLNTAIPGNDIHVRTVADSIILTGSVASAGDAQKAADIASGFIADAGGSFSIGAAGVSATGGSSGKVINSLTIRGLDQVSLRVTVAEIRREVSKQLGVNMSGSGPNGSLTLENPFAINGALSATQATLNWFRGSGTFSATLRAFERQGVAHTLAEPTVTAVSGESAKFMAGGTIPIANSETCSTGVGANCVIGFIQQPYGVTLNFTPVVLSQGRIQLRIATEVTDIDYANQVTYNGISIPGFRTRNNVTTVELPSGGSIATAGLISTASPASDQRIPGTDEPAGARRALPFARLSAQRDRAHDRRDALHRPRHRSGSGRPAGPELPRIASDPQAVLLGMVNRIYSTSGSLQPLPGYAGKIGFVTW